MRRWLGVIAGLVAAVIGTLILMSVVEDSSDTTVEQPQLVSVLVVRSLIPRQTGVEFVGPSVELTQIPIEFVAPDAVSSLDDIQAGLVTATELLPGEQLLLKRFVDPRVQSRIAVPDGLQEVTISLPVPQALGGSLIAGDQVGVIASFSVPSDQGEQVSSTTFILHNVLVTAVQFSTSDASAIEETLGVTEESINKYPGESILITLAVSSADAARVVFSAEFGRLWLTLEGPKATVGGEGIFEFEDFFPVNTP